MVATWGGKCVLFGEVSSFHYRDGIWKGVLFREVSSVQGCPSMWIPLYIYMMMKGE